MTTAKGFASAKINLTLHITGQRPDGYHLLDSLVVFADVGDQLHLTPEPAMRMSVTGPFAQGVPTDGRNLAWQAAQAADWTGHIALDKQLPHGAGIGGGSADAAAVLRMLGDDADPLTLGADVPVCMLGRAAHMRGIGEDVTPVEGLPPLFAVLVNPGTPVSTPAVFAALENRTNPPMDAFPTTGANWIAWLNAQRNDLETAAQGVEPAITEVLGALSGRPDCLLSRMSGSGATCFGLFPDATAAEAAARALIDRYPTWWVKSCLLG